MKNNLTYFIAEILLEQFPISSSGHILLLNKLTSIPLCQEILIYLPHIFLLSLYIPLMITWASDIVKKSPIMLIKLIASFFTLSMTTLLGKIFFTNMSFFKSYSISFPLWLGFGITSILLYIIKKYNTGKTKSYYSMNYIDGMIIGAMQIFAFLPGISRMSTVLLGSILRGYKKEHAFIIATLSNACISFYSLIYCIYKLNGESSIIINIPIIDIFVMKISFFVSIVFFFLTKESIKKNKIDFFYWYEILIAIITFFLYQ
jgi:undecaprenyl pyrophosphate phosphatase UppP